MLPQENFLMFQPLGLFLVASEHSDGFPSINIVRIWDMFPPAHSTKL